jgi:cytochrome c biogenesis protein CcmG/thiol:disulfide interchange protein DsbE
VNIRPWPISVVRVEDVFSSVVMVVAFRRSLCNITYPIEETHMPLNFIATAVALTLLLSVSTSVQGAEIAPDWTLTSSRGQTISLSDEVKQQTTVLFFWATWCPYCQALMPHLQSLRLEYGEDIKILAINFREDGDPVAFIENAGYDFTVLPGGDDVAATYGIKGTPGLIIVDSQQRIQFDLRALPRQSPTHDESSGSHKKKAGSRAPYWAAEIRKGIDSINDAVVK